MNALERRLSRIEAVSDGGKWVTIDEHGNLPDDFIPGTDSFIVVTIQGERKQLFWRGKPFEAEFSKTITIGGE